MRLARPLQRYLSGEVTRVFGERVEVVPPVRVRRFHEPGMRLGMTVNMFSMQDNVHGLFQRVRRFKASSD